MHSGGCCLVHTAALTLPRPATCPAWRTQGGPRTCGQPRAGLPLLSGPRQSPSLSGSDFSCIKQARQNESLHTVVRESTRWTVPARSKCPYKQPLPRNAPGSCVCARACESVCVCAWTCVRTCGVCMCTCACAASVRTHACGVHMWRVRACACMHVCKCMCVHVCPFSRNES